MKQGSISRRGRSRGNGRRHGPRLHAVESSGPDVKVRGTAQQVLEKYLALARDAWSAGDRVAAEGYFQHADHYYRLLNEHGDRRDGRVPRMPNSPSGADDAMAGADDASAPMSPDGSEPEPTSA